MLRSWLAQMVDIARVLGLKSALFHAGSLAVRRSLVAAVLFIMFFVFLAAVQFSTPDLPDNDGFYHIRMAYLMRTEGLKPEFPWLPLTILNPREFYDHHFLFHVALIPFTFGDLRLGAKLAAVFFASLAFFTVWRLLDRQRIRYSWVWALGLMAVSEAFIYRLSIARAQSVALFLLVLGFDWLLAGKFKRLIPLGFIFVWTYDGFPLLVLLALIYSASKWLVDRRFEPRPILFAAAGIMLGLVINPYFPYDLIFIYRHLGPKLFEATAVRVGNEWYPYDTGQLLGNSPFALISVISGIIAVGLKGDRMDLRTAMGFLSVILFGWMLFQARRFIEYFPAFALVFGAFAWSPLMEQWASSSASLPKPPGEDPGNDLSSSSGGRIFSRLFPVSALMATLIIGVFFTLRGAQASILRSKPFELYEGASAWLEANTEPGERVFQTDWDDFPRLFYYNRHNTYLVGLDPTYMQLYNPELFENWVAITRGEIDNPSRVIFANFGARFVISDLNHNGFLREASQDAGLVEVYRDEEAAVFRVVE